MFNYLCKNKIFILSAWMILILPLCGYGNEISLKRVEPIMGTYVEVTVVSSDKQTAEDAIRQAFAQIKKIDALTNPYKKDSEIGRLNRLAQLEVSPLTLEIVEKALYFSRLTGGALDITYKPIMDVWKKAEKLSRIPTDEELREAALLVDYRNISIKGNIISFKRQGMNVDLSCIAKGYAVDNAINALKRKGIERALVNAGGDIYALGRMAKNEPWHLGVQDPGDSDSLAAVIELGDKAVATSGNYERYFTIKDKTYPYIFNPKTGRSRQDSPMGVTVVASDCKTADALSTACFILGPEKGIKMIDTVPGAEAFIISEGVKKISSRGFNEFLVD